MRQKMCSPNSNDASGARACVILSYPKCQPLGFGGSGAAEYCLHWEHGRWPNTGLPSEPQSQCGGSVSEPLHRWRIHTNQTELICQVSDALQDFLFTDSSPRPVRRLGFDMPSLKTHLCQFKMMGILKLQESHVNQPRGRRNQASSAFPWRDRKSVV